MWCQTMQSWTYGILSNVDINCLLLDALDEHANGDKVVVLVPLMSTVEKARLSG